MTALNVPCQIKYFVIGTSTSPNKGAGEVMVLVQSFMPDKDKIGGIIHKELHKHNNESHISSATNWLGLTISDRGSKLVEPKK